MPRANELSWPCPHATAGLFALSLTGRDDARLCDGSLTEWSVRPDLPLVTG
jgi:thiosulfate/3-mercaptopyruvate sulfurtransferase